MSKLDKELRKYSRSFRSIAVGSPANFYGPNLNLWRRSPLLLTCFQHPENAVWREINAKKSMTAIDAMLRCLTVDWPFF